MNDIISLSFFLPKSGGWERKEVMALIDSVSLKKKIFQLI